LKPERSLLVLTRYGALGSSSRLRMLQYLPALSEAGLRAKVSPFFEDVYLRALYGDGQRRRRDIFDAYLRRSRVLGKAREFDLVWIEKELFPFLPGPFEARLSRLGVPYVVDYDDATFHRYDLHGSALVRRLLGRKLVPLIRSARLVTAGNAYLANYARRSGGKSVEVVPTVVDLDRYPVAPDTEGSEYRIGWIGSPSTTVLLSRVRRPLERLASERPVRLVTIGAGRLPEIDVPSEQHPWTEETEAALLSGVHVGIMPLDDEPWQRGKCGYKLIQYMACGKPVVASPVGMNKEIVTRDVGCLALGDEQWYMALLQLGRDPRLRARMGRAGRADVERTYSLQVQAPRVARLLAAVAGL
jgi:glycosyltransferase involved in cell wall biosynthesis